MEVSSNAELKTQQRGTTSEPSYEPLSSEEGWNPASKAGMKGNVSLKVVLQYVEPGTKNERR